jgi:hypothetical protein
VDWNAPEASSSWKSRSCELSERRHVGRRTIVHMVSIVVTAAAVVLILFDMARVRETVHRPAWEGIVRAGPFVVAGALSIFVAGQASRGRHLFQMDFSLSREELVRSMTKVPHLRSIAILFLLAVIAFGVHRLLRAFAATMLVGAGWEIAEATVVGHHARLADLAPNLVAGVAVLLLVTAVRFVFERWRPRAAEPS